MKCGLGINFLVSTRRVTAIKRGKAHSVKTTDLKLNFRIARVGQWDSAHKVYRKHPTTYTAASSTQSKDTAAPCACNSTSLRELAIKNECVNSVPSPGRS